MTLHSNGGGTFGTIVKWLVIGFLTIVGLKIAIVAVGFVLRFAAIVLFTLGPILLLGWLVVKLLRRFGDSDPLAS